MALIKPRQLEVLETVVNLISPGMGDDGDFLNYLLDKDKYIISILATDSNSINLLLDYKKRYDENKQASKIIGNLYYNRSTFNHFIITNVPKPEGIYVHGYLLTCIQDENPTYYYETMKKDILECNWIFIPKNESIDKLQEYFVSFIAHHQYIIDDAVSMENKLISLLKG